MGITADLEASRDQLAQRMFDHRAANLPASDEAGWQFIHGYIDVVVQASKGNTEPLDHYMHAVIPGIKASGIPWAVVMDSMIRVAMVLVAVLPQHAEWLVEFNGDYVRRLCNSWEVG